MNIWSQHNLYLTSNKTNVSHKEGWKAEHKHAASQGTEEPSGWVMRDSTQGPQPTQEKGTCALHTKFPAISFNGGKQMLPEIQYSCKQRTLDRASGRGAPLLLHFSWACCSCNSPHHASDITADAALLRCHPTLILHPQQPMEMQAFPLIMAVSTKIAHLTFANTKQWI